MLKFLESGAGEMDQHSREHMWTQVHLPATIWWLRITHICSSREPSHCSGICGHQAHAWCTHSNRALTHRIEISPS